MGLLNNYQVTEISLSFFLGNVCKNRKFARRLLVNARSNEMKFYKYLHRDTTYTNIMINYNRYFSSFVFYKFLKMCL